MDKIKWTDILKKNNKEFQIINEKDNYNDLESNYEQYNVNHDLKDIDEEFERLYFSKITDIKIELMEYIRQECLPFLDRININNNYDFFDYIKYNCKNLYTLKENIEKENKEYLEELKEEEEEEYYNNDYDV